MGSDFFFVAGVQLTLPGRLLELRLLGREGGSCSSGSSGVCGRDRIPNLGLLLLDDALRLAVLAEDLLHLGLGVNEQPLDFAKPAGFRQQLLRHVPFALSSCTLRFLGLHSFVPGRLLRLPGIRKRTLSLLELLLDLLKLNPTTFEVRLALVLEDGLDRLNPLLNVLDVGVEAQLFLLFHDGGDFLLLDADDLERRLSGVEFRLPQSIRCWRWRGRWPRDGRARRARIPSACSTSLRFRDRAHRGCRCRRHGTR
mmetsp:Transcript_108573/g.306078  ORF Transcript_108573/g.306078 Transcript_108573/m.306078 type:complete len:254 (+) Transcript_108573:981-1742(+)